VLHSQNDRINSKKSSMSLIGKSFPPARKKMLCQALAALLLGLPVAFYGQAMAATHTVQAGNGGAGGAGGTGGDTGSPDLAGTAGQPSSDNNTGGAGGQPDVATGGQGSAGQAGSNTGSGGSAVNGGQGGAGGAAGNYEGSGGGGGGGGGNSEAESNPGLAAGEDIVVGGGSGGAGNVGGSGGAGINSSGNGNGGWGGSGGQGGGGGSAAINSSSAANVGTVTVTAGAGGSGDSGGQGGNAANLYYYGGQGGNGGGGGQGGNASATLSATQSGDISLAGGSGGDSGNGSNGGNANSGGAANGGNGGQGGNGGNAKATLFAATQAGDISLAGGNGGKGSKGGNGGNEANSGYGGNGGNGGNANVGGNGGNADATLSATQTGGISLAGGDGGQGGNGGDGGSDGGDGGYGGDGGKGGTGGNGGNTSLELTANIVKTGDIDLTSGENGAAGLRGSDASGSIGGNAGAGGDGGTVSLTANQLNPGNITLAQQGGTVDFNVGTLEIDTTTKLAASGFSGGAGNVTHLLLAGKGNYDDSAVSDDNRLHFGDLEIDGGTVSDNTDNGNTDNWASFLGRTYATTSAITLEAGGADFDVAGNQTETISRVLAGSGGLAKSNAGTLVLTGNHTYTGETDVEGGGLVLAQNASLQSALLRVGLGASATLRGSLAGDVDNTQSQGSGSAAQQSRLVFDQAGAHVGGNLDSTAGTDFILRQQDIAAGAGHTPGDVAMTMLSVGGQAVLPDGQIRFAGEPSAGSGGNFTVDDTSLDLAGTRQDPEGFQGRVVLVDAAPGQVSANYAWNGQKDDLAMRAVSLVKQRTALVDTATGDVLLDYRTVANPAAKSFVQGWLSGMALLDTGGDMVAGAGLQSAQQALAEARKEGHLGWKTFAAVEGADVDHDTGSHIRLRSWSMMAGLAASPEVASGDATVAAFVEYGKGNYDTNNAFSDDGGDLHYWALGLLGKRSFANNFYVEGSLRGGRIKDDFNGHDLHSQFAPRTNADYGTTSSFYSAHVGGGYVSQLNGQQSVDSYAKYFYTHEEGDSDTADTGDKLKFDDVDSSRVRLGSRFVQQISRNGNFYVGAAYEHEYDAKTKTTAFGKYKLEDCNLKGDTWIGEAGLSYQLGKAAKVDFSVEGFTGQRQGGAGNVEVDWAF
jgi:hypothetical protein